MMKKIFKIIGFGIAGLIMLLIFAGLSQKATYEYLPPPGEMVDVGGFKLHINCVGEENALPTVILQNGQGMTSFMYHWIQNDLSKTTRVCTYDRPGMVWSEVSGVPSDAENVSQFLHTLLEQSEIKRPYILAGHSFAGLIMRVYADKYPDEIAGLAFLDVTHPDQYERMELPADDPVPNWLFGAYKLYSGLGLNFIYNPVFSEAPPEDKFPAHILKAFEQYANSPQLADGLWSELKGFSASLAQAAKITSFADIPILVIAATLMPTQDQVPDTITPEKFARISRELQLDIAALSTDSKFYAIDEADHGSLIMDEDIALRTASYLREFVFETARKLDDESN